MSQTPSSSQSPFLRKMLFNQARLTVTKLRDTMQEVSGKEDARDWAEAYGSALVRGVLSTFGTFR